MAPGNYHKFVYIFVYIFRAEAGQVSEAKPLGLLSLSHSYHSGIHRGIVASRKLDLGIIKVANVGFPCEPSSQCLYITPLDTPPQVFLVLLPGVPVFYGYKVIGVVLVGVERESVTAIKTACVMKFIPHPVNNILATSRFGVHFEHNEN